MLVVKAETIVLFFRAEEDDLLRNLFKVKGLSEIYLAIYK